jgi:transposase
MKRLSNNIIMLIKQKLSIGRSSRQISEEVGISKTSVLRVRNGAGLENGAQKGGRPRKLTARDRRQLVRNVTSGRKDSASGIASQFFEESGIVISSDTVRRALRDEGMTAVVKKKKPLLLKKHRIARMEFARKYEHWLIADWERVLFSDETKINRFGSDGNRWVWIKNSTQITDRDVQGTVKFGGGSIMIWGCMMACGVGHACRIDGRMDSELYVKILAGEMLQSLDFHDKSKAEIVFMQDNDPKHKSRLAMEWLQSQGIELLDWPPQSPDLNPIEHLWSFLKRRLGSHDGHPSSMHELWVRIEREWECIAPIFCANLINSMPRRIAAIIKARGGYTDY